MAVPRNGTSSAAAIPLALLFALAMVPPAVGNQAAADEPARAAGPLENYFGNTLVCLEDTKPGDHCHMWLNRDGTYINIDRTGPHPGHYRVGPQNADGSVPVCLYWDNPQLLLPEELLPPRPTGGIAGKDPAGGIICDTKDFHTTCTHYDSDAGLAPEQATKLHYSIAQRFHEGMCYPFAARKPGEIWKQYGDPLPSGAGYDKMALIRGRR